MANTAWKETRRTVESTVKQAAGAAVNFAQQVLPRSLPAFELPMAPKRRKSVAKTAKPAKRAVKVVKKAKSTRRSATKRG
jgi:hypothetical protein